MKNVMEIKAEIFDLAEERGTFEKEAQTRIENFNARINGLYAALAAAKTAEAGGGTSA